MSNASDIAEARALLEDSEREPDHELKAHKLEEALIVLETIDDASDEERRLVENLRMSYARRLLQQLPSLQSVTGDEWFSFFAVLIKLNTEIDAIVASDRKLGENFTAFAKLWGNEVLDILGKRNAG